MHFDEYVDIAPWWKSMLLQYLSIMYLEVASSPWYQSQAVLYKFFRHFPKFCCEFSIFSHVRRFAPIAVVEVQAADALQFSGRRDKHATGSSLLL